MISIKSTTMLRMVISLEVNDSKNRAVLGRPKQFWHPPGSSPSMASPTGSECVVQTDLLLHHHPHHSMWRRYRGNIWGGICSVCEPRSTHRQTLSSSKFAHARTRSVRHVVVHGVSSSIARTRVARWVCARVRCCCFCRGVRNTVTRLVASVFESMR
jgi:hypothetical protein